MPVRGASRRGVSRPIWTAESGPLVTGRVTMKWLKRPLHNSTLRWSHSSSTPHSHVCVAHGTTKEFRRPEVEADAVDAAAGRPKRGLHRQPRAARRRARWSSLKLLPCSRRPLSQPRRMKIMLPVKSAHAYGAATHAAHSWASPAMDDGLSSATHHAQRRARAEHPKRSRC